jgi:hypothetical protein
LVTQMIDLDKVPPKVFSQAPTYPVIYQQL